MESARKADAFSPLYLMDSRDGMKRPTRYPAWVTTQFSVAPGRRFLCKQTFTRRPSWRKLRGETSINLPLTRMSHGCSKLSMPRPMQSMHTCSTSMRTDSDAANITHYSWLYPTYMFYGSLIHDRVMLSNFREVSSMAFSSTVREPCPPVIRP
jgi:hypothetical protein